MDPGLLKDVANFRARKREYKMHMEYFLMPERKYWENIEDLFEGDPTGLKINDNFNGLQLTD